LKTPTKKRRKASKNVGLDVVEVVEPIVIDVASDVVEVGFSDVAEDDWLDHPWTNVIKYDDEASSEVNATVLPLTSETSEM